MQIQPISNTNTSFRARNAVIIEGEFLKNGAMLNSIVDELNSNKLYQKFCSSNKTHAVITTMKPGSTCIAMFGLLYKPAKKGIMKLFSFLQPYQHLSFGGYGEDYKKACANLKTEMFDPMVGSFNTKLSEALNKG